MINAGDMVWTYSNTPSMVGAPYSTNPHGKKTNVSCRSHAKLSGEKPVYTENGSLSNAIQVVNMSYLPKSFQQLQIYMCIYLSTRLHLSNTCPHLLTFFHNLSTVSTSRYTVYAKECRMHASFTVTTWFLLCPQHFQNQALLSLQNV